MTRRAGRRVSRIALAYLVALIPTLTAFRLLNTSEYLAWFVGFPVLVVSVAAVRLVVPVRWIRIAAGWAELVLLLSAAALIAFSLNLTPASAYLAWFRLVQDGSASGVLSVLFTLKVCFFATATAVAVLRRNIIASVFIVVAFTALVLYAVFQDPRIAYLSIAAAVLGILVTGIGNTRRPAFRRLVPLAQIIVLAGLVAYPLSRTERGAFNPLVAIVPTDIIANLMTRLLPNFPFLYNVPGYGHQLGEKSIGDRPALTARPVFRVTGEPGETVYLRTEVFDYFTGTGWTKNPGQAPDEAGFEYFTAESPVNFERPLRVEILIDFFSSVPHTLDTRSINFYRGDFPPFVSVGFDSGFLFEIPVVRDTVFYLDRVPSPGDRTGPEEEAFEEVPPRRKRFPENLGNYLQVPGDVPDIVRRLAEAMIADDPIQTSENFKRYLTSNYYYSLDTTISRYHENPAWSFLMGESSGYCVHFATAYVMLARLSGIPARYVTGFLVNIPRDSDTVDVPGYAAHAWVEIWTPETGWITREATPPMLPEYFDDPTYYDLYNPLGGSYTGRQLEIIMGDRIPPRPTGNRRVEIDIDFTPVFIVLGGILVLIGAVWFFVVSSRAPGSRKRRLTLALRGMVRKSSRHNIPHPGTVGWVRWAHEVSETTGHDVSEAVDLAHRVYFGGDRVEVPDIRNIRRLRRAL